MERIMSARELSAYLVAKFRRDGTLPEGIWVDKGELILPIGPELDRFCEMAKRLRQNCDKTATSSRDLADAVASMYEDAILYGSPIDSAADMICRPDSKTPGASRDLCAR